MRKSTYTGWLLLLLAYLFPAASFAQAMEVRTPVKFDISIPLRDMKPDKKPFFEKMFGENDEKKVPNKFRTITGQVAVQQDPATQTNYPVLTDQPSVNPLQNFPGVSNNANSGRVTPPDPAGDVGLNHYVQVVNSMMQIFTKTGTSVYGPVMTSTLWNGFNGNWSGHNDGDAIVLYDEAADRWLVTQFAIDCSGSPYTEYELVAISTTGDPTGSYYRYAFQFDYMPDYPKLGVWEDGYYMAVNRFNTNLWDTPFVGTGASVMQRSKMLVGDPTASMIYFKTELLGGSGSGSGLDCYSMLPSDCDGTWAPAGTPNYFTYMNDNSWGGNDELRIWALSVNWTTPASSTFTYVTAIPVTAYTLLNSTSVPQQGTTNKLDGLEDRLMFRNQYRNFGSYASFLTCHVVNAGSGIAGMRWYEYRKTGTTWSMYQQSTYNPGDGKYRWMGSVAMNANGDIGMVYSVSSSSMYPSIYFTGRRAADALNQMTQTESIIQTGTVAMTGATRWGDYANLTIDPTDNTTFWATHEYVGTYGGTWPWATKIASFKFSNQPTAVTNAATAVTLTTAQLNGNINPNGVSTTYYFQWGTTISYGNTTTTQSAGSGTSGIPVNASIGTLIAGTTYHFRVVGVNTDGTSNGNDLTFTPGAAALTTAAASAITSVSATSGGTISSDGGSAVTARGVCWSTTTNPVATGNHTTDGTGTGSFISNITGLTANTTYYVRAYATNGTGTYYGNEITFNSACGTFTVPFSESFTGTTLPNCWSNVDNSTNGQVWQFGVITGYTPNPILTGNYAYLNSDAYGAGYTQNADLISPTLNLTGYSNITLAFSHYFRYYSPSTASVYYSINNGSTWTLIQQFTATTANPAQFNQVIAALANQTQVKFKWNYSGSDAYYWAIDNISVTGSSALTLTVTPPNQNVPAAPAGNTTFNVTSNAAWTAVSNQSWCTVTPSGSGNGTITANFTENTTTSVRTANVTVTVIGLTPVVVTVTQAAAAATLSVTPPSQNVTDPAGSVNFTVTSNSSWTAVSNQSWCTVTPSGTGNGTIVATYTANTSSTPRTASITVTATGATPVTVTVVQSGAAPFITVTPPNQNVPASPAGNTTFSVTSNISWTATCAETWCTVTPSGTGNGVITATYTENFATSSRVAVINISGSGAGTQSVTVTQSGTNPTLSVSPSNQNVTSPAGSTIFNVTSNSSWIAFSDVTWCLVTSSGSGNGNLTANYLENTSTSQRIAYVTVSVAGLPNQIVTVTQQGSSPSLSVTPEDEFVDASAGSIDFTVVSNSIWNVVSDAPWCIVTPSGSGSGVITTMYGGNTTGTDRVANITVTVAGIPPQVIKLHQSHIVGISTPNASGFAIVPNPTPGQFRIVSEIREMEVSVIDMSGKTILTRKCNNEAEMVFDLSGAARGSYLVKISFANGTSVHRLILAE